jgi:hypothetical protein
MNLPGWPYTERVRQSEFTVLGIRAAFESPEKPVFNCSQQACACDLCLLLMAYVSIQGPESLVGTAHFMCETGKNERAGAFAL